MKEKLLADLKNQDLEEMDRKYIVAVVEYIDSNMQKLEGEDIDFAKANNRMLELVHSVNSCCTGIDYIDNKEYRTSHEELGVIHNFIATISNYGGLYKYVCETYHLGLKNKKL